MRPFVFLSAAAAIAVLGMTGCNGAAPTTTAPAASPAQENADLAFRLALLEGHLRIGRELIAAGQNRDAIPHFGHPVREIYGDLRPVLDARRIPQFDRDLIQLEALAASEPTSARFSTLFDQALAEVAAARASIPEAVRSDPEFLAHEAADIAGTAGQEYRNAFIAGRIGSAVEYHDTRGFIFYARSLLRGRTGDAAGTLARIDAVLAQLQTFVAPLNPPDPPRGTPDQFDAQVNQIRQFQSQTGAAARSRLS